MPKPVIEGEDVADTVRQAVFLMKVAHPEIDIEADIKEDPLRAQFDRRLISQALTNIIKNATEAVEAVPAEELGKGRIDVVAQRENAEIIIDVVDNGIGLPKVARQRLLEPYVTTRAKGTGLGLAIVGRVLEDHGGRIELKDAADFRPGQRGAWMRLRFAVSGHASNVEAQKTGGQKAAAREQGAGGNPAASETKAAGEAKQAPAGQTPETARTTNSDTEIQNSTNKDTKTEAATGS
jgi:two-component system, NtrC family, nitrogen regulation sensor histidine kinase NtrY